MGVHAQSGLVGRERELADLGGWLTGAAAGGGRLVLVAGEPGIGKTRVVEELLEVARQGGVATAVGRAVADEAAPPLWPWLRAWRSLPTVSRAAEVAGDRTGEAWFRFADQIVAELVAAAEPGGLLVVLEDLHWADSSTLRLLRHLVPELGESRVLVAATYRDPYADAEQPFALALPSLLRESRVEVMRLRGLAGTDVATLVDISSGGRVDPAYAPLIHARTDGNPLYIRTLARVLADEGGEYDTSSAEDRLARRPEMRDLVRALVAPLTDEQRRVLLAAATLGADVDEALVLAAVDGADVTDALRAGVAAGVVTTTADEWRFSHAVLRDGLVAATDPDQRAAWHRAAAEALQRRPGVTPARVASHWASVPGAGRDYVRWAGLAADAAMAGASYDEASSWSQGVVRELRSTGSGDAELAGSLLAVARAEYAAGRVRTSAEHCLQAAECADRAGRGDLVASAALVVQGVGDPMVTTAVARLCRQALADGGHGAAVRARLLAQLTCATHDDGAPDERSNWSREAVALARSVRDPVAEFEALRARQMVLCAPDDVAERVALGARAVELGEQAGLAAAAMWGHLWRADAAFQLGHLDTIDREILALVDLVEELRQPLGAWHLLRLRAARAAVVGDLDAADAYNREAISIAARTGDASATGMSESFGLRMALLRMEPRLVTDAFWSAIAVAPPIPVVRVARALARLLTGDRDGAQADYQGLRGLVATMPYDAPWLVTTADIARLAAEFGDTAEAEVCYRRLSPYAAYCLSGTVGSVFCDGAASLVLGVLATALGRSQDAEQHLRDAVVVNDRFGARPFSALSRLELARVLATKDLAEARALAGQAGKALRRLGLSVRAAQADELLASWRPDRWGQLTPREREVAGLVAEGLSNRAIAQRLVLSERTVESHVAHILAKLGATSRTRIAVWATEQGAGRAG